MCKKTNNSPNNQKPHFKSITGRIEAMFWFRQMFTNQDLNLKHCQSQSLISPLCCTSPLIKHCCGCWDVYNYRSWIKFIAPELQCMLDVLGYVGFVRTDFVCGKQEIHWDQGWLTKKVWALTLTRFPSMRTARAKEQVFAIKWKLLCINYTFWSFETATYTQMYTYLINNKTVLYTRHEKALKQNPLKSPMSPDASLICTTCETEYLNASTTYTLNQICEQAFLYRTRECADK